MFSTASVAVFVSIAFVWYILDNFKTAFYLLLFNGSMLTASVAFPKVVVAFTASSAVSLKPKAIATANDDEKTSTIAFFTSPSLMF